MLLSWLKSKTHWWLFLAAAFVAFFHCLVLGKGYFADDLLYGYGPFRAFFKQQVAMGHFPLWNPYQLGGQPYFADPNNMLGYPVNYFTLLFSVPYGYGVFYFLHIFIAALGMRFWMKSLRISEDSARMLALVYALSGYFWFELIHPPILAAYAWLPIWMGALEKLSQEFSAPRAFGAGLAAAVIFLCGSFQMTSCFYYTGIFYFLGRLFLFRETSALSTRPFPWKKIAVVLLFGLWGSLPLFTQLIPAYEFSKYSDRTETTLGYDNFNSQWSLQPASLYQFFFPTMGVPPGKTIQICMMPQNSEAYMGVYAFIGIWGPFLAVLAFRRKEKKLLYFCAALGALSVLTAFGKYFPLHRILCIVLPTINLSRVPGRYIAVYVAFACILAAFGFQGLEKNFTEKAKSPGLAIAAGAYGLVFLVFSFVNPVETWSEMLALGLGTCGLVLWGMTESWKKLGKWIFLGGLLFPLLLNGWGGYNQGDSSNFNYKEKYPVTSTLGQSDKGARYVFQSNTIPYPVDTPAGTVLQPIPDNIAMVWGLRNISGYNPIFLKKTGDLKNISQAAYLQLMAVRGILVGRDGGDQPNFIHRTLDTIHLYEFKTPPPFVTAPYKPVVVEEGDQLNAMKSPDFNPIDQALLAVPLPPSVSSQLTGQKAQLKYELTKDDTDDQVFKINLDKPSLVAFSEVMYPGWRALVDQKPSEIFTSNYVFRSLFIPAGDHEVEFLFQPPWFKPIVAGSVLWVLSALAYTVFLWRKRNPSLEPNPV